MPARVLEDLHPSHHGQGVSARQTESFLTLLSAPVLSEFRVDRARIADSELAITVPRWENLFGPVSNPVLATVDNPAGLFRRQAICTMPVRTAQLLGVSRQCAYVSLATMLRATKGRPGSCAPDIV